MTFLSQRAEDFIILRRKPIAGYDISFLVTNFHTEEVRSFLLVLAKGAMRFSDHVVFSVNFHFFF